MYKFTYYLAASTLHVRYKHNTLNIIKKNNSGLLGEFCVR